MSKSIRINTEQRIQFASQLSWEIYKPRMDAAHSKITDPNLLADTFHAAMVTAFPELKDAKFRDIWAKETRLCIGELVNIATQSKSGLIQHDKGRSGKEKLAHVLYTNQRNLKAIDKNGVKRRIHVPYSYEDNWSRMRVFTKKKVHVEELGTHVYELHLTKQFNDLFSAKDKKALLAEGNRFIKSATRYENEIMEWLRFTHEVYELVANCPSVQALEKADEDIARHYRRLMNVSDTSAQVATCDVDMVRIKEGLSKLPKQAAKAS